MYLRSFSTGNSSKLTYTFEDVGDVISLPVTRQGRGVLNVRPDFSDILETTSGQIDIEVVVQMRRCGGPVIATETFRLLSDESRSSREMNYWYPRTIKPPLNRRFGPQCLDARLTKLNLDSSLPRDVTLSVWRTRPCYFIECWVGI